MISKPSRYGYNTVDPGNLVRVYHPKRNDIFGVVIEREVFAVQGGRTVEVTVLVRGEKRRYSENLLEIVTESKVYTSPSVA